jgi:hypothetical protein
MTKEDILSMKVSGTPRALKDGPRVGVYFNYGRWKVELRIDGKVEYFGSFKNEQDAIDLAKKIREARAEYLNNHPQGEKR